MRGWLKVIALGVAASFFTVSTAHSLTIDSFDGTGTAQTAQIGNDGFDGRAASSAIGGARKIRATKNAGPQGLSITGNIITLAGLYSHSADAQVVGSTLLSWDSTNLLALNPSGLGGVDFYQDGAHAVVIDVFSFDYPNSKPVNLLVTVYDSTNPGVAISTKTLTLNAPVTSTTSFSIPFADFVGNPNGTPADFHHVGAVTLQVSSDFPDVDLTLDWIGTDGQCRLVPDSNHRVIDDCGVCGGDNSSCADCKGIPNGPNQPGTSCDTGQIGLCKPGIYQENCSCLRTYTPQPEICDGIDNNCDGQVDEAFPLLNQTCGVGTPGCNFTGKYVCSQNGGLICDASAHQAEADACDKSRGCDGVPASGLVFDICGVCGGNGTSCLDCLGVVNGPASYDRCGVCNGDGESCLECKDQNISSLLTALDTGAKHQERLLKDIYAQIEKGTKSKKILSVVKTLKAEAHRLQIRNWTLSWTVPVVSTQCANVEFCVTSTSNGLIVTEYRLHAHELRNMVDDAVKLLRQVYKKKAPFGSQFFKKGDTLLIGALKLTDQVPLTQSTCTK